MRGRKTGWLTSRPRQGRKKVVEQNSYVVSAVISDAAIASSGTVDITGLAYQGLFEAEPNEADVISEVEVDKQRAIADGNSDAVEGFEFIIGNIQRYGIPDLPDPADGDEAFVSWGGSGILNISREALVDNVVEENRALKSWTQSAAQVGTGTNFLFGDVTNILTNTILNNGTPINFNNGQSHLFLDIRQGPVLAGNLTITGTMVDPRTGQESVGSEVINVKGPGVIVTENLYKGGVNIVTSVLNITRMNIGQVNALRNNKEGFVLRRFTIMAKASISAVSLKAKVFKVRRNGVTNITGTPIDIGGINSIVPGRHYQYNRVINETISGRGEGFYVEIQTAGLWNQVLAIVDYDDLGD